MDEASLNPLTQAGRKAWHLYRRDKSHEIVQVEFADRLKSDSTSSGTCCLCRQGGVLYAMCVCSRCRRRCLVAWE